MSLIRWDPYRELEDMSNRLQRLFARPFERETGSELMTLSDWYPAVDIEEDQESFHIKAELPAVAKEDVRIEVTDGILNIAGERHREKEQKGIRCHRSERSYGMFQRSFTLPENVDAKQVDAQFRDGVLDVRLPKVERSKQGARQIEIR